MKTLIIYASTYGYTKECVEKLKELIDGEVIITDIKKDDVPSSDEFDNIIIGGSIYMGQIHKKLKEYCTANLNLLLNKKIALFLCCGLPENFDETIKNCFPTELLEAAIAKECFGGELRTEKMRIEHKMISGLMQRASTPVTPETMSLPETMTKLAARINEKEKKRLLKRSGRTG